MDRSCSDLVIPLSIGGSKFSIVNDFSLKNFCKYFGPGLLVSIAYLDPGNRINFYNYSGGRHASWIIWKL